SGVIAREALRRAGKLNADLEGKSRHAILDGIAWFATNWTPAHNANAGRRDFEGWHLYYLYSVEKAMEMAGVETLAGHNWWREGCAQILALEQKPKRGTWRNDGSETALALLFLNRATLPARLNVFERTREATGGGDSSAWDEVKVEGI